jgi:hypothetical protein
VRRICALAAAAIATGTVAAPAQATSHYIFTVAGNGVASFGGDEGAATRAQINLPRGVSALPDGGFLVAEADNNTVRRIYTSGKIRLVAGDGTKAYGGDGGPATQAQLDFVHDVAALPDGGFLIADMNNRRVRRVYRNGTIKTVAGNGNPGPRGDGGPATRAQLNYPHAVAPLPDGGFLIADTENDKVRRVAPDGEISTIAGDGVAGYSGDGGPATSAQLDQPFDVAPLEQGGFLIADVGNHAIRKVSKSGRITTVAGTGVAGFSGDGGPATSAQLDSPHSVAALPGRRGFVIADTRNDRVRLVKRGKITTIVGDGDSGYGGDGGRAEAAELDLPKAVDPTGGGGFLIADSENERVRFVSVVGPRPLAVGLGTRRRSDKAVRVNYRWTPVSALEGGRTVLRFRSTEPARGTLTISGGDGFGETLRVRVRRGRNRIALPPEIGPGGYSLRLVAATTDGQRSTARGDLRVLAPDLGPPAAAEPSGGGISPFALLLGAAGIVLIGGGAALALRERRLRRRDRDRRARAAARRTRV